MHELLANPAFCEALRQRKQAGLELPNIILGPLASSETVSAMETLAREGVIHLFRSSQPQSVQYMVTGDTTIFIQEEQDSADASRRFIIYEDRRIAALFTRRAQAIIQAGLAEPFEPDHPTR